MNSIVKLTLSLLLVGTLGFITGCEDDDDDVASGNSVIQGNVAAFAPTADKSIAGDSKAAIEGITVRINGLNIKTTTAADGSFVLTGVPAGDWTLMIVVNGVQVTYPVTVGENEKVILSNIVVTEEGAVVVGNVASVPVDTPVGGDEDAEEDDGDDKAGTPKLSALSVSHSDARGIGGISPAFDPDTLSYHYPDVWSDIEIAFEIDATGEAGTTVTIDGKSVGNSGSHDIVFGAYAKTPKPAGQSFVIPVVVSDGKGGKTSYMVRLTVNESI